MSKENDKHSFAPESEEGGDNMRDAEKKAIIKSITKRVVPLIILMMIITLLTGGMFTVREDQYALVKKWGTQFSGTISEPGLYLKVPIMYQVEYLSKAIEVYEIPPSEILTKDKKKMMVDLYVTWSIDDPETFKRSLQTVGEAHTRMELSASNIAKNVFSSLDQNEIVSLEGSGRERLNEAILTGTKNHIQSYGLKIMDVRVKGTQLPETNETAVYTRMISERRAIAMDIEATGKLEASKIINDTNKQVGILLSEAETSANEKRAQAESEYLEIMEQAYSTPERQELFKFLKELEVLESTIQTNTTVILGKDSVIAELLK